VRNTPDGPPRPPSAKETTPPALAKKKLSYLEAREYEAMETNVAKVEHELNVLRAALKIPPS